MNIKYQVGKDDELKCSKEEKENNKEIRRISFSLDDCSLLRDFP